MRTTFRMTGTQEAYLKSHLLPDDGKESAALVFCTIVSRDDEQFLLVKDIVLIPHEDCLARSQGQVIWPTETHLLPNIERMDKEGLCLIAFHSHPANCPDFSSIDDKADRSLFSSVYCCLDDRGPHGSAIMLPNGKIRARLIDTDGQFSYIDRIAIAGDRIIIHENHGKEIWFEEYSRKNLQVFGKGTLRLLKGLRVGIVGLSGTGSPVADLLIRHSVGTLVIVDFDHMDNGVMNRISIARAKDAMERIPKVKRYEAWVTETGLPTKIIPLQNNVRDEDAIQALSTCDVIFGCVDNAEARHFLNMLCCAYLIPFFDLGVSIKIDQKNPGEITHAVAKLHYVQPDKSCLMDREVYTSDQLSAENYKKTNPEYYAEQVKVGYLTEVGEEQPAVMVLTSNAANMGVEDMLARLHGYRLDNDKGFAEQERNFTHGYYQCYVHDSPNRALKKFVALADTFKDLL